MSPTDQILFQRWRERRDADAFARIAAHYGGLVYAVGRRITGNAQDAEDIAQACFEKLAAQTSSPKAHLAAWLHRVATNHALNVIKAERRRADREARYARERPNQSEIGWDDIYDLVDEAIAVLPGKQRDVVVAHYLEGKTHDAIARELGISRPAVTQRVQAGVAGIRSALGKRGIAVPVTLLGVLLAHGAEAATPVALAAQLGKIALSGYGGNTGAGIGLWQGMVAGLGTAKGLAAAAVLLCVPFVWFLISIDKSLLDSSFIPARVAGASANQVNTSSEGASGTTVSDSSVPRDDDSAMPTRSFAAVMPESLPGILVGVPPRVSVSGIVVDSSGMPVSKGNVLATLNLSDGEELDPQRRISSSVEDGTFTLESLPVGAWTLVALPGDWSWGASSTSGPTVELDLKEGENRSGVRLVVAADRTIDGRVLLANGKPVEGAKVWASDVSRSGVSARATTDHEGRYTLKQLVEGNYDVRAEHDLYSRGEISPVPVESRDVDIVLELLSTFEGQVIEAATSAPVQKFYLSTQSSNQPPEFFESEDGRFRLEQVDAGATFLHVSAPGFEDGGVPLPAIIPGKTATGVLVQLAPAAEARIVRGIVLDADRNPVEFARVHALTDGQSSFDPDIAMAYSFKDGSFEIKGMKVEPVCVAAIHDTLGGAQVELDPERAESVTLVLEPGGVVEGTVTVAGAPGTGAQVSVLSATKARHRGKTDFGGRFRMTGVSAGLADITFSIDIPGSGHREKSAKVLVEPAQITLAEAEFPLATSVLEGTVYAGDIGVSDASVAAVLESSDTEVFNARCDAQGFYRFETLPAGAYSLRVNLRGEPCKVLSIVITEGAHLQRDIDLDSGTAVVCSFDNLPEPFARIRVGVFTSELGKVPRTLAELGTFQETAIATNISTDGQPLMLRGLDAGIYTLIAYVVPSEFDQISSTRERELLMASFEGAEQIIKLAGETEVAVTFSF